MYNRDIIFWVCAALGLWFCFNTVPGSGLNILAIVSLAVFSRLASGNFIIFFVATGILAVNNSDIHSQNMLAAVYLPLYVMLSMIYILGYLVALAPALGNRTGTGINSGGDGGGGGC